MALVRWSPFRDVLAIQNEMNRFVDDLVRSQPDRTAELWPASDVSETDRDYQIHVELPGMEMKDIKVQLTDDVLLVHGEKKQEAKRDGKDWRSVERSYGRFERSFRFPVPVQGDKIKARYANGILSVTVPKGEEVTPREIQIEG